MNIEQYHKVLHYLFSLQILFIFCIFHFLVNYCKSLCRESCNTEIHCNIGSTSIAYYFMMRVFLSALMQVVCLIMYELLIKGLGQWGLSCDISQVDSMSNLIWETLCVCSNFLFRSSMLLPKYLQIRCHSHAERVWCDIRSRIIRLSSRGNESVSTR